MAKDYLGINLDPPTKKNPGGSPAFTYKQQANMDWFNDLNSQMSKTIGTKVKKDSHSWDSKKNVNPLAPSVIQKKIVEADKKIHQKEKKVIQPNEPAVYKKKENNLNEIDKFPIYKRDKVSYDLKHNLPGPAADLFSQTNAMVRANHSPYQKVVEEYASKLGIPASKVPKNAGIVLEDYGFANDEQTKRIISNMAHESSKFTKYLESFYYKDPERIKKIFNSAFKAYPDVNPKNLVKNSEELGAFVYKPKTKIGKQLGNKTDEDARNFIGKGPIQLTGRSNVVNATNETGVNYVKNSNMLLDPEHGFLGSVSYWKNEKIDKSETPESARLKVNSGGAGFEETMRYYRKLGEG